jgi:hypothetical protein
VLVVSTESCSRHKRLEIKNTSSYNSLRTLVTANGREVFNGEVARAQNNKTSHVATFRYRGDSCMIQVDIPDLSLRESKNFVDLEHKYIVITITQSSANNIQVSIDAPQTVALGAAE